MLMHDSDKGMAVDAYTFRRHLHCTLDDSHKEIREGRCS